MRCSICRKMMIEKQSHDFLDDGPPMTLKAWRCGSCGNMMEEIQILSRGGKKLSRRFRYVVRPWESCVTPSSSSEGCGDSLIMKIERDEVEGQTQSLHQPTT